MVTQLYSQVRKSFIGMTHETLQQRCFRIEAHARLQQTRAATALVTCQDEYFQLAQNISPI
jgi:hypothetical protein